MTFSIGIKDPSESKVFGDDSGPGFEGLIRIGDLTESFFAVTVAWTQLDYERSWDENLATLREGRDAYFLTDVSGGDDASVFFVWPAFHHDGSIYFTQKLLLRSNAGHRFGLRHVPEMIDFDNMRSLVGGEVSFFSIAPEDLPPSR